MFLDFMASKYPENYYARIVGKWAYSNNYGQDMIHSTQKLFLEACFDLSMCCFINLSAFYNSEDFEDFSGFFNSFDNCVASLCTIITFIAMITFIIYGFVNIRRSKDNMSN